MSLAQKDTNPVGNNANTPVQSESNNDETPNKVTSDSKGGIPSTQIILLLVLLLISGFLSGSETSFTAVGRWKIRQLFEEGAASFWNPKS